MSPELPRINARTIEKILAAHGFELVSQKGSHRKWRHAVKGLMVIVPSHKGKTLPLGTMRSIMKASEIDAKEWVA